MPRARVPNARFLASADSPILPFLAPRVFAESPIPRKKLRHVEGRIGSVQEKKEKTGRVVDERLVKEATRSDIGNNTWSECRAYGSHPRNSHGSDAGGLLHMSLPIDTNYRANYRRLAASSLNLRYADISSFTHQQTRSYATVERAESVGKAVPNVSSRSHRKARQGHNKRDMIQLVLQDTSLLASRRKRALAKERKRMTTFLSYKSTSGKSRLLMNGQYRSLRRRIFNLTRSKRTNVDMTLGSVDCKVRSGILRAFAALDRSVYPGMKRKSNKHRIKHDPQCVAWAAKLFHAEAYNEDQVWRNWMDFDNETRESYWQLILLYLLDRTPHRAQQFIQVLTRDRHPDSLRPEILADALGHLARIHTQKAYDTSVNGWKEDDGSNKARFIPVFCHILRIYFAQHPRVCSQDLLYNVATLAEVDDLKRVWNLLIESKTYLGYDTILHYANRFGAAGEHKQAVLCLKEIRQRIPQQSVLNRERFRWSCALILRKSMSKGQTYHETTSIIAEFVKLGVKLDILLYNVIMHNAMEAGDYVTAFKVYNTLEENGLKPDRHTYSILLHGCTLQNDPARFHDFAEHCAQMARELNDPWLGTDYLYYLYVRHHQEEKDTRQTLGILATNYCRFFSTTPLEPLLSQDTRALYTSTTDSKLFEPPLMALYIMLQMEIQHALHRSSRRAWDLYARFRSIIRQESYPILDELGQNPVIWNAFLLAFCRKEQFASASQLIKDMTDYSPQPNIYSWNIFMQAFFKTGQVQAAERVFEIIRSRGVNPDQFTYGVLLRGYAKAQNIERIGEIMEHVDSEHQLDPQLLSALARVHKRQRLMFELEKVRIKKEKQLRDKEEMEAQKQKKRWEPLQSSAQSRPLGTLDPPPPIRSLQATEQGVAPRDTTANGFPKPKYGTSKQSLPLDDSNFTSESSSKVSDRSSPMSVFGHSFGFRVGSSAEKNSLTTNPAPALENVPDPQATLIEVQAREEESRDRPSEEEIEESFPRPQNSEWPMVHRRDRPLYGFLKTEGAEDVSHGSTLTTPIADKRPESRAPIAKEQTTEASVEALSSTQLTTARRSSKREGPQDTQNTSRTSPIRFIRHKSAFIRNKHRERRLQVGNESARS